MKTAVEWFFNELSEVERNLINKTFLQNNKTLAGNTLREIFQQAKEMEKQQKHFAYQDGREDVFDCLKKMDYDFLVDEINKTE